MSEYTMVKLKRLRKAMGLSQLQLAALLDVGQTTIAAYESGICNPGLVTAKKLAKLGLRYEIPMTVSKLRGE
jgi:transcriptional regulator with XRE-family HTH domain